MYAPHGTQMPVFLYEDYKYNPEDPEEGLFRGAFLVCVSQCNSHCSILTSSSQVLIDILYGTLSVDVKNVKRKDEIHHHCLAEKYNLQAISAENIAYAAVVVSQPYL
jgi:hypothetical protein